MIIQDRPFQYTTILLDRKDNHIIIFIKKKK